MYTFFQDSGHGWLKVRLSELCELNIEDKVSHFSYYSYPYVYLEEDSDLTLFMNAKGFKAGESAARDWWQNNVIYDRSSEVSHVRNMDRYVTA